MPTTGSQCYLCDLPVHFDIYKGCSHQCQYCFAKKFKDLSDIKPNEGLQALKNFIEGKRDKTTNWCDWNIPLHIGGMSDPLQPVESTKGITYKCLQYLAETQYPFIISTKGKLLGDKKYIEVLSKCNCVVQVSLVCKSFDKLELGCPSFDERLKIIKKVSPYVKRVIIRIQPYMHEVYNEVFNNLSLFKDAGVYGVIVEGIKLQRKKQGLVKVGGDFTYPYELIKSDFLKLKDEAHRIGLKIYAGENRIRALGDSLTCCGVDEIEGFKPNKFNLNHLVNGDKQKPTEAMTKGNTAMAFKALYQDTISTKVLKEKSFANKMLEYYKENTKNINTVLGKEH